MPYSHLFKKDKMLCACNQISIGEAAEFVKTHNIQSVQEWIDSDELPAGNKCEACIENGTDNDGVTLAVLLSQVRAGKL
jgi:bacterioferritin-associated ferredoxin